MLKSNWFKFQKILSLVAVLLARDKWVIGLRVCSVAKMEVSNSPFSNRKFVISTYICVSAYQGKLWMDLLLSTFWIAALWSKEKLFIIKYNSATNTCQQSKLSDVIKCMRIRTSANCVNCILYNHISYKDSPFRVNFKSMQRILHTKYYGTKPLLKPMLTYHQKCSLAFTWGQFHRKCPR